MKSLSCRHTVPLVLQKMARLGAVERVTATERHLHDILGGETHVQAVDEISPQDGLPMNGCVPHLSSLYSVSKAKVCNARSHARNDSGDSPKLHALPWY